MNDKHGINISHKQLVTLVNYIEQKITIAPSLPNFHNNKMKVIDGYVCECSACFTKTKHIHQYIVRRKKCSNYKKESIITTKGRRTISYHQYQEVACKSLLSAVDTPKVISIISTLVPQYETVL